jgi:amino acid transporter
MIWVSICLDHIRFRAAWITQGFTLAQSPYRAPCGVYGSYIGLFTNMLCLAAIFYNALYVSVLFLSWAFSDLFLFN